MTLSMFDILHLVLAIGGIVLMFALIWLIFRLQKVAAAIEEAATSYNRLSPKIERVVDRLEIEIAAINEITNQIGSITKRASDITIQASEAASRTLQQIAWLTKPIRLVLAVAIGVASGLSLLSGNRHKGPRSDSITTGAAVSARRGESK